VGTGTGLTRDGVPGFACPQGVPPNLPVPTVFPSVRRVPPGFACPQGDGWGGGFDEAGVLISFQASMGSGKWNRRLARIGVANWQLLRTLIDRDEIGGEDGSRD
jgi:hypothetical protein